MSKVFISYRRDDSASESQRIREAILEHVEGATAFLDVAIQAGQKWPDQIREALVAAETVVAVIGPGWLRSQDRYGRRRLDAEDDWVRTELETALASDKKIVPVMLGGEKVPPIDALPNSLQALFANQGIEIRQDYWEHDIQLLLKQLIDRPAPDGPGPDQAFDWYPHSPYEPPAPLSPDQIAASMQNDLGEWKCHESPLPSDPSRQRQELSRTYLFDSFAAAIGFMAQVAPGCDIAGHHPRWENVWKTLVVRLSTWDGNLHQVTDRDVTLARYFDCVFESDRRARKAAGGGPEA